MDHGDGAYAGISVDDGPLGSGVGTALQNARRLLAINKERNSNDLTNKASSSGSGRNLAHGDSKSSGSTHSGTSSDASAAINLRCPKVLDQMVAAKEEEESKANSVIRRAASIGDNVIRTFREEAMATEQESMSSRRASLASLKQSSKEFVRAGSRRQSSVRSSMGEEEEDDADGNAQVQGLGAVRLLSTAAKSLLGSEAAAQRRHSSNMDGEDKNVEVTDEKEQQQQKQQRFDTLADLRREHGEPKRVSSRSKILNSLRDEIIDEDEDESDDHNEDTNEEQNEDDVDDSETDGKHKWDKPLERGISYLDQEEYSDAIVQLNDALLLQRDAVGMDDLVVAETLNYIGVALTYIGDSYAAMTALKESLWIREHHLEEDHNDVLVTRRNLLRLYAMTEEGLGDVEVDEIEKGVLIGRRSTAETAANGSDNADER